MWEIHGAEVLCLHRDKWLWRHIKAVREMLADVAEGRAGSVAWRGMLGRRWRDQEVESLWDEAEP